MDRQRRPSPNTDDEPPPDDSGSLEFNAKAIYNLDKLRRRGYKDLGSMKFGKEEFHFFGYGEFAYGFSDNGGSAGTYSFTIGIKEVIPRGTGTLEHIVQTSKAI